MAEDYHNASQSTNIVNTEFDDSKDYDDYHSSAQFPEFDDAKDYDDYQNITNSEFQKHQEKLDKLRNNSTIFDYIRGVFNLNKEKSFGNIKVDYDDITGNYTIVNKLTNKEIGGYGVLGEFGLVEDNYAGEFIGNEFTIGDSFVTDYMSYIERDELLGKTISYSYMQTSDVLIIEETNTTFNITTDTHYWVTNQGVSEVGLVAEILLDIGDLFDNRYKLLTSLIKGIDIVENIFLYVFPGLSMLQLGNDIKSLDKIIGTLFMVTGAANSISSISNILDMFDIVDDTIENIEIEETKIYNIPNNLLTIFKNSPTYEQIEKQKKTILLSPYNSSMKFDIPKLRQIKNIKDNTMEATISDSRGGLSNVLEPHLIGSNEASEYENVSLNSGIISSYKIGTKLTNISGIIPDGKTNKLILTRDGDINASLLSIPSTFGEAKLGKYLYIQGRGYSIRRLNNTENYNILSFANNIETLSIDKPTKTFLNTTLHAIGVYDFNQYKDSDGNIDATLRLAKINKSATVSGYKIFDSELKHSFTPDEIALALENNKLSFKGTWAGNNLDKEQVFKANDYEWVLLKMAYKFNPTEDDDGTSSQHNLVFKFDFTVTDLDELKDRSQTTTWENYKYAVTYYDEDLEYESEPIFTDTVVRKTNSIKIKNIPYATKTNLKIRLYRLGGYYSIYKLIKEFTTDTNKNYFDYIDTIEETDEWKFLDTENINTVTNLIYVTEHNSRLFGYKDNKLYYTAVGKANAWSNFKFITVGGNITATSSTSLGLLICTETSTYLLSGDTKENFKLTLITSAYGCTTSKSIQTIKSASIWYTGKYIVISVGSSVQNISEMKVNIDDIGTIYNSFSYKDIYYLIGSNYTLKVDFRFKVPSFSILKLNITSMFVYKGKLCYINNNKEIYSNLGLEGTESTLKYKSLMLTGKAFEKLKEFKSILVVYKGDFKVTVYKNKSINILETNITSSNLDTIEIKLPTDKNQGLGLQLGFEGTGEIYSYKFIFNDII